MIDFTQWTLWHMISLIPIKKKKSVNEEGQDQQPEATMNASCKLFHWSHTALLYVGLRSSSLLQANKTAAWPDVQLTGASTTQTHTPMSLVWGAWSEAALATLLLGSLFQCALWGGRALEPLGGDGGLVGHALPHHVAFPPQCDFLHDRNKVHRGF